MDEDRPSTMANYERPGGQPSGIYDFALARTPLAGEGNVDVDHLETLPGPHTLALETCSRLRSAMMAPHSVHEIRVRQSLHTPAHHWLAALLQQQQSSMLARSQRATQHHSET